MVLQAAPGAPIGPLDFIQLGVLGVIFAMVLTGWLWPKPAVEQLQKLHSEERKLWEERILPTMERMTRELQTNTAEVKANTAKVQENTALVAEAIRVIEKNRRGVT